jgi:hypothetical protein
MGSSSNNKEIFSSVTLIVMIERAQELLKKNGTDAVEELIDLSCEMSIWYAQYIELAAIAEHNYNKERADKFIFWKQQERSDGKMCTDAQAEKLSKKDAEHAFGNYKVSKAKAHWFKAVIEAMNNKVIHLRVIAKLQNSIWV